MKLLKPTLLVLTALACMGCALAQSTVGASSAAPVFPVAPPPAYVKPSMPQGSGKFGAVMEADVSLPTHTVYRPANLTALGGEKLPIVAFGNGACVNVGNRFRYFLSEIASHGFLAIATGPIGVPTVESAVSSGTTRGAPAAGSPGALHKGPLKAGEKRPADTTAQHLLDAVTWAIAENSRTGSQYYGKLDTTKVAVMGQSCGGIQAIDAAHDPRVTTLGVWNSGAFPIDGMAWTIAAANADKATLASLHGSAIYISGEPSDVAFKNADDDYARIETIPIFRGWREQTGHSGTYREPNGGEFGVVAVAWLQFQLKGDQEAAKMFVGPDCGLCKKPNWHVQSKNLQVKK
jgi:dienelactone hydrolase